MYGTNARLPVALNSANRSSIRARESRRRVAVSDEIVTDADAITIRILSLDDGAQEHALGVTVGEIDDRSRMDDVALLVADDSDNGTRQHILERIHRMHDAQLERIEHDQRPDWIDPGQVDERFHDYRVHPAPRIVAHLLHDLSGCKR